MSFQVANEDKYPGGGIDISSQNLIINIYGTLSVVSHHDPFRFNCGKWFARSEDDGSVERLLIAERVPQTMAKSGTMSALSKYI